jgi:RNA 2',3'-cyclic 3'-phosphodiesterase
VRLFIALELDPAAQQALAEHANQLRNRLRGGRISWVKPENLHITLRFLGGTSPERAAEVVDGLKKVRGSCCPIEPNHWGAFPTPRNAKVVWAGLPEAQEQSVAALAKEVEFRLQSVGVDPEPKPFRAHVTVGRVRDPVSGLDEAFAAEPLQNVGMSAPTQFVLKESRLGPGGPEYIDFAAFEFVG